MICISPRATQDKETFVHFRTPPTWQEKGHDPSTQKFIWEGIQLASDRSANSRTSIASARSHLAPPDLNSTRLSTKLQIAVGTTGPQQQAPDTNNDVRTQAAF